MLYGPKGGGETSGLGKRRDGDEEGWDDGDGDEEGWDDGDGDEEGWDDGDGDEEGWERRRLRKG